MAFVAFYFLPDSTVDELARFPNEEEKEVAKARAISQVGIEGSKRISGISLKDNGAALIYIPNWLTAVCCLPQPDPSTFIDQGICHSSCTSPAMSTSLHSPSSSPQSSPAWGLLPSMPRPHCPTLFPCLSPLPRQHLHCRLHWAARARDHDFTPRRCHRLFRSCNCQCHRSSLLRRISRCSGHFPAVFNIVPWTLNNQGSDSGCGTGELHCCRWCGSVGLC
jgi:hypothetical protein